jgi:hypothetical protein
VEVPRWLTAYLGLLAFLYGVVFWLSVQVIKVVWFFVMVLFFFLVYGTGFCFGKLQRRRVVPISERKG